MIPFLPQFAVEWAVQLSAPQYRTRDRAPQTMLLNASTSSLASVEGGEKGLNTNTLDAGEVRNGSAEEKKKVSVFDLLEEILANLTKINKLMESHEAETSERVTKLMKRVGKIEELFKQ